MPRRSSSLDPGAPRPPLRALAILLLAAPLMAPGAGGTVDWVTYVDETPWRLVADPTLGVSDPEEKTFAVGDFNRNGRVDVVLVRKNPWSNNPGGGRRNVLFMNENGTLVDRTAEYAPDFFDLTDDRNVAIADVDDDGWPDIITSATGFDQPRILINLGEDENGVWLGFEYQPERLPALTSPTGNGPKFCGLGVGDVTGDGSPDLYFTDYLNNLEDKLLINDGMGFFTDETVSRLTPAMANSTFATDAHIVDVNGNGFNDVIKVNTTGTQGADEDRPPLPSSGNCSPNPPVISVLYNNGSGHFTSWDHVYCNAGYRAATADFTQDGRLDLFVVDDGQDRYLINTDNDAQGHAQFTEHFVGPSPKTTGLGGNVQFADLDGDGVLDVLVSDVDTDISGCSRRLALLRGVGTPPDIHYLDPLGAEVRPWNLQGTFDVAVLDLNDNGRLDLVIGTCNGTRVFMAFVLEIFADGFESGDTSGWITR